MYVKLMRGLYLLRKIIKRNVSMYVSVFMKYKIFCIIKVIQILKFTYIIHTIYVHTLHVCIKYAQMLLLQLLILCFIERLN